MTSKRNYEYARDCDFIKVDDPDHVVPSFPIRANGTHFLPATDWDFGTVEIAPGNLLGCVFLRLPTGVGIHQLMSPVTMRILAARLERVAGEIEDAAALQTADAFARAARPGAAA